MKSTTDADFYTDTNKQHLVVVDIWAPWCGPCKALSPVLDDFALEHPDIEILKLNADENEETCKLYSIKSIPTLLFFKNGVIEHRSVGLVTKEAIKKMIENV